jgi:excisionase family DNA binding protein
MADQGLGDVRDMERRYPMKRSWWYEKVSRNEVPHLKIGKLVRFDFAEVDAWLASHHRGPKPRTK